MANMLDNQLEVRGPEAEVAEFIKKTTADGEPDLPGACEGGGDIALHLQHSEKLRPGLYDVGGESRQLYCFRTKWRPPIELVERLSRQYPELEFALHYLDLLGGYCGDFEAKNGAAKLQNESSVMEISAYERRLIDGSLIPGKEAE